MKSNIHPQWHPKAKVTCACGNTFTTGSTLEEITVDICSQCHPFYTGEMRFVDVQGRVEKFQAKQKASKKYRQESEKKKKEAKVRQKQAARSLKEVLTKMKKEVVDESSDEKSSKN